MNRKMNSNGSRRLDSQRHAETKGAILAVQQERKNGGPVTYVRAVPKIIRPRPTASMREHAPMQPAQ
jgi:hypothetical protein